MIMKEAKVIVSYETLKELETQNKEMVDLLFKLLDETDIDKVKNIINEFNSRTKYLWI